MVHVIGGNVNSKLNTWLKQLFIEDFVHVRLDVESIDPAQLLLSADQIKEYVKGATALISVGPVADRVMNYANLHHGTLPSIGETDKETIKRAILECKNYLTERMYNVYYSRPPSSNEPG